jgi:hypothetical protein
MHRSWPSLRLAPAVGVLQPINEYLPTGSPWLISSRAGELVGAPVKFDAERTLTYVGKLEAYSNFIVSLFHTSFVAVVHADGRICLWRRTGSRDLMHGKSASGYGQPF